MPHVISVADSKYTFPNWFVCWTMRIALISFYLFMWQFVCIIVDITVHIYKIGCIDIYGT